MENSTILFTYECNFVCCKMMDVFYDRIITAMKNAKSIYLKPPFLLALQNVNDIHHNLNVSEELSNYKNKC